MLSIIIPTYEQNGVGASYLMQLLQSIQAQDFNQDLEVVISDNSEGDAIENVISTFPRPLFKVLHPDMSVKFRGMIGGRILYLRNQNKGAAENTNCAIDQASGQKIKIMFQDDLLLAPDALTQFSAALDAAPWAFSDSMWLEEDFGRKKPWQASFDIKCLLSGYNTVGMPSVIGFRKTDIRFDTTLQTLFDIDFYLTMFQKYGAPAHINKPLIGQRIHSRSLSNNQADKTVEESLIIRKRNASLDVYPGNKHDELIKKITAINNMKKHTDNPYLLACLEPSDIQLHLPLLKEIAMQCHHVTEFGARDFVSTLALIEGTPRFVISYDFNNNPRYTFIREHAISMGVSFGYVVEDVRYTEEIPPTDFLFIDTLHDYDQVRKELQLHAGQVRKFIAFHDVTTFGLKDESDQTDPHAGILPKETEGLLPAIFEFLVNNPEWRVYRYQHYNNGMLILKRSYNER